MSIMKCTTTDLVMKLAGVNADPRLAMYGAKFLTYPLNFAGIKLAEDTTHRAPYGTRKAVSSLEQPNACHIENSKAIR